MTKMMLPLLATAALAAFGWTTMAGAEAPSVPKNWHVHDCNIASIDTEPACTTTDALVDHKPAGFFPAILGVAAADYVNDPAMCPNATDKAFLPSWGNGQTAVLRAGVCQTSTKIIHLRTVLDGTAGPEGWTWRNGPEAGYDTWYEITSR